MIALFHNGDLKFKITKANACFYHLFEEKKNDPLWPQNVFNLTVCNDTHSGYFIGVHEKKNVIHIQNSEGE